MHLIIEYNLFKIIYKYDFKLKLRLENEIAKK